MIGPDTPTRPRLAIIDVVRGVAIIAMIAYHATFDLGPSIYGLIEVDAATYPPLVVFARLIAGTFLFLVGVSLVLAHGNGIRWRPFWRRFAIIAGAAIIVTVATRIAIPDYYTRFGILHSIAAASLIGLLFLRLPVWLVAVAAVAVFLVPVFVDSPALSHPAWLWLGLGSYVPPMMDYEPVFPWIGPTLAGIVLTRIALRFGVDQRIGHWVPKAWPGRWLAAAGRWSLVIYLIHQPILLALFYLVALIALGETLSVF